MILLIDIQDFFIDSLKNKNEYISKIRDYIWSAPKVVFP